MAPSGLGGGISRWVVSSVAGLSGGSVASSARPLCSPGRLSGSVGTCGSGGSEAMPSSVQARSWDRAGDLLTMITPATSAARPPL